MGMEQIIKIIIMDSNDEMFEMTDLAMSRRKNDNPYHAEKVVDGIKALGKYHFVSIVLPPDKDERLYFVNTIRIIRDITTPPISIMTHGPYDAALKLKVMVSDGTLRDYFDPHEKSSNNLESGNRKSLEQRFSPEIAGQSHER